MHKRRHSWSLRPPGNLRNQRVNGSRAWPSLNKIDLSVRAGRAGQYADPSVRA